MPSPWLGKVPQGFESVAERCAVGGFPRESSPKLLGIQRLVVPSLTLLQALVVSHVSHLAESFNTGLQIEALKKQKKLKALTATRPCGNVRFLPGS